MSLTKDDVAGIAAYARIALTEDELDRMCAYLNDALRMLEPIRSFDLEGVEPTFHPIGELSNVMADDTVNAHNRALPVDVALKGTAAYRDRSFRVPSILGDGGEDRP